MCVCGIWAASGVKTGEKISVIKSAACLLVQPPRGGCTGSCFDHVPEIYVIWGGWARSRLISQLSISILVIPFLKVGNIHCETNGDYSNALSIV